MESYKRHATILDVLRQFGEVTVEDLARRLNVSENTIRNDLNTLEDRHLLVRVRGGAVPVETVPTAATTQAFPARSATHHAEKRLIGAWAAQFVHDSDSLVLDASSTAYQMATFLHNRNHLTVLTNGLHVALLLAQNPTNHVMLASNTIGHDGFSTIGAVNADIRRNFRASKAFVSCTGLTLDWGLAEVDVEEATIKGQMVELAREVIALVDHSKFGRVETYRAIALDKIHRLITDDGIAPETLDALRRACGFPITVVGDAGTQTYAPGSASTGAVLRIGFGNLTERMAFARQVREGLEAAASQMANVELLVRDNDLQQERALANADWFVAQGVDLVIEYQTDYEAGNVIMDKFNRAGIPVIAVDIGLPGATFFGADNYRAGYMAGEYLGQWVRDQWGGQFDTLLRLESARVGTTVRARLQGMQDGFESVVGRVPAERTRAIYNQMLIDDAQAAVEAVLPQLGGQRTAIIAINDDAAVGALRAFEAAGRLHEAVAVGQNADRIGLDALRRPDFPFIATTRYGAEDYGTRLLELALLILNRQPVPPAVYTDHTLIHRGNLDMTEAAAVRSVS